jgi:rod shape-determining protein MreD
MTAQRIAFRIAVVVTACLAQVGVINRMGLPGGGPDLLLLIVVAFGLVGGSQRGALLGFGAGLTADLLPPADHLAGQLAFAYTVIGYLAGLIDTGEDTSVLTTILAVAGGSVAVVLLYAGLGTIVGDGRISPSVTLHSILGTVVYDVILAPLIVPLVTAGARRLEPVGPRVSAR